MKLPLPASKLGTALVACLTLAAAASCSSLGSRGRQKPAAPLATVGTATLDITPGIKVLARHAMPDGFVPIAARAPMWLQGGNEIGVIGARDGRTVVLGFGGPGWRDTRVIAEDDGPGLRGRVIMDVAASPDGMTLALAAANPKERQVNVVIRDLIAVGAGGSHSVASFDGIFETASVGWSNPFTVALVLKAPRGAPGREAASADGAPQAASAPGLYLVAINGTVIAERLKLDCPLSPLSWSPRGHYAVGQGDTAAPPVLVDQASSSCRPLSAISPIRVLDWSHGEKSFLYAGRAAAGVTAAYRYDLPAGPPHRVAISSGAAAFTSIGDVLALGNSRLTLRRTRELPNAPVRAELALLDAKQTEIRAVSLGFATTPAMLAESTMTYSRVSKSAAVSALGPGRTGLFRKIITYRLAEGDAFVVAFGPARGPVLMSWSPKGRYLAIVDANAKTGRSALTILEPPL